MKIIKTLGLIISLLSVGLSAVELANQIRRLTKEDKGLDTYCARTKG